MIANSFASTNIFHGATKQCGAFRYCTQGNVIISDVKGTGCDAKGCVHEAFPLYTNMVKLLSTYLVVEDY